MPDHAVEHVDDPLARGRRREEAAVEEHRVGPGHRAAARASRSAARVRNAARCRVIAGSLSNGSPSSRSPARRVASGTSSAAVSGRNPSSSVRTDFFARQRDGRAAADDPRPPPRTVIGNAVRTRLGRAAAPLPRCTFAGAPVAGVSDSRADPAGQLLLDERGERQIEVVAAEQQVLADRDPLERQSPASTPPRIRLKSVVPPPTSQTRTSAPSPSVAIGRRGCAAIHA